MESRQSSAQENFHQRSRPRSTAFQETPEIKSSISSMDLTRNLEFLYIKLIKLQIANILASVIHQCDLNQPCPFHSSDPHGDKSAGQIIRGTPPVAHVLTVSIGRGLWPSRNGFTCNNR